MAAPLSHSTQSTATFGVHGAISSDQARPSDLGVVAIARARRVTETQGLRSGSLSRRNAEDTGSSHAPDARHTRSCGAIRYATAQVSTNPSLLVAQTHLRARGAALPRLQPNQTSGESDSNLHPTYVSRRLSPEPLHIRRSHGPARPVF